MPIFDHPEKILAFSNGLYIFAAVLTVVSTLSVVYFGNRVTVLKESQLKAYQKDADARIAEANSKAAQANEKAEREHLARMKIEERLSGRRVSLEKHDEMVGILKPFQGSMVIVAGLYGIEESKVYAIDIVNTLRDAGWQATLDLSQTSSNPPIGIVCKPDVSKPAGQALKSALQKLPNVKIIPTQLNDTKNAGGTIVVGLRPPP
jgi:hypothetical protein